MRIRKLVYVVVLIIPLIATYPFLDRMSYEVSLEGMIGWPASEVIQTLGEPYAKLNKIASLKALVGNKSSNRAIENEVLIYHYSFNDIAVIYVSKQGFVSGVHLIH